MKSKERSQPVQLELELADLLVELCPVLFTLLLASLPDIRETFGLAFGRLALLAAVAMMCIAMGTASAEEEIKPLERITIKPGEERAEFILKRSKQPFFVKGFNYIRLRGKDGKPGGDHATFDANTKSSKANYDPKQAETMFSTLSKSGYNTVRVFVIGRNPVNPGIAGDYKTTKALYEPYVDNFIDFLRRATRHNIRVFPTLGDGGLPLNAYYRERVRGKWPQ